MNVNRDVWTEVADQTSVDVGSFSKCRRPVGDIVGVNDNNFQTVLSLRDFCGGFSLCWGAFKLAIVLVFDEVSWTRPAENACVAYVKNRRVGLESPGMEVTNDRLDGRAS